MKQYSFQGVPISIIFEYNKYGSIQKPEPSPASMHQSAESASENPQSVLPNTPVPAHKFAAARLSGWSGPRKSWRCHRNETFYAFRQDRSKYLPHQDLQDETHSKNVRDRTWYNRSAMP